MTLRIGMIFMAALSLMPGCDDGQQPSRSAPPPEATTNGTRSSNQSPAPKVLYATDFQDAEVGPVPEEMFVLDGEFAVRQVDGNKLLELPGQPLAAFAVLFGPYVTENVEVTARIHTERNRRRFPRFGVGLGGAGGVKLRVDAAADHLTLYNDDLPLTHVDYTWPAGKWVRLKLRVTRTGDTWLYQGKAWPDAADEPADWMVRHESAEEPIEGPASVWGTPYADRPIRFDDLQFVQLPAASG